MDGNNVLFICVDEWPGYLFGHAGRGDVMTPTIDFLAEEGIRMENAYSECPVCIPARRSLMTGLSPRSHGDRVYSDRMEMPDVPTLASTFRDAGYQTVAVGKLHVYPQRSRIGFDEALITEEGRYEFGVTDDHQIWLGEHGLTGRQFLHGMGSHYSHGIVGAGVAYGYAWMIGKHWNLEAEIGVGYAYTKYDVYRCPKCGSKLGSNNHNYFGPTKAAVSLVYLF